MVYDAKLPCMPVREENSNKGSFGKVLNFCGSNNYIGAAYLATMSSLRIGAGYSALSSSKSVIEAVSKILPESVYYSHKEGLLNLKNYSVILLGSGLGLSNASKKIFKNVIKILPDSIPIIVDGDGLSLLAEFRKDKVLAKFVSNENKNCIITPHPKEAAKLLNTNVEWVLENLEEASKNLTDVYKCITVLKTHRTIVNNKNNNSVYINKYGNSALAKAGTGDVLAGTIAGLVAQKMDLYEAAKLGVFIHSRAGEIASKELTEYCLLSSELSRYYPAVIKELIN